MRAPDDDAFLAFVAARSAALRRTAVLLTGDWHTAEDLVAAALLSTWTGRRRLRDPAALEAYVRTAMVRQLVSWRRRRSWGEVPTDVEPDALRVPDHAAEHADADLVRRALRQLPARQRAVVVLKTYEQLPEAEIAALLGISAGAVKTHSSRGLATLRRLLALEDPDAVRR